MDVEQSLRSGLAAYDADEYRNAVIHLLPLAINGHKEARYRMAEMYRDGNGIEQNAQKSLRFYKAAAEQDHAWAAFNLSLILHPAGNSTPPSMQLAEWDGAASERYLAIAVTGFNKMAEAGDTGAMAQLGFLYHTGLGVDRDGTEAIRWYTKSFELGHHWASNGLCLVYYEGDPKVRDKDRARFWYSKANEFGCRCIGIDEFEAKGSASHPTRRSKRGRS